MSSDKIPWIKKEEQPKYSNDIFPMCFFQLQSLDDDTQTQDRQKGKKNIDQMLDDATKNFNEML